MSFIGERLKLFILLHYGTQKAFSQEIGLSVTALNGYVRNIKIPGGEVLTKFAETGLNINWLLTGEGNMKIDKKSEVRLKVIYTPNDNFYKTLSVRELEAECIYFEQTRKGIGESLQKVFLKEKIDFKSLLEKSSLIGYVSGEALKSRGLNTDDYVVIEKLDAQADPLTVLKGSLVIVHSYDSDSQENFLTVRYYDNGSGTLVNDDESMGEIYPDPNFINIIPAKITSVIRPFEEWI